MYKNCKLLGPYKRPDNREHMIIVFPDGRKSSLSYPKYLMELYLGRYLTSSEVVHHIDGDPSNNDISNLMLMTRSEHASLDGDRIKDAVVKCIWCEMDFVIKGKTIKDRNRRHAGPFCSKSCSGKYGAELQNGRIKPLDTYEINREYYREI